MASDARTDAYWQEYAVPVLREYGFLRSRQGYLFDDAHDGHVFVTVHRYLHGEFRIGVAVAIAPITRLLGWWNDRVDVIGDASWATHLNRARPGDDYLGDWPTVDDQPERDRAGAELATYVREQAIPLAMRLLDYDELLDEIRHRRVKGMTPLGEYALVAALLAERGPNIELDALLEKPPTNPFEDRAQKYARRRLTELEAPPHG